MNQFKFLTVLILSGSLILASCSKDDDQIENPPNNTEKKNKENSTITPSTGTETPVEKKNMISFKIDGEDKSFEYKDNKKYINFVNNGGISYTSFKDEHKLNLAFNNPKSNETFYVTLSMEKPKTPEVKTYEGRSGDDLLFQYGKDTKNATSREYRAKEKNKVTIKIVKFDIDNNYIEGTFEGEVFEPTNNKTIQIKEGKFSGSFYKEV